jgi:dynein intermediate chain 2
MLCCNRKAKTSMEKVSTPFVGHIGPIYSVQRNPAHSRFILTIGDWTARLWMDDFRMPILSTPFDTTYLSAGGWSPTRPSLFFTGKNNGMVDVWDMMSQSRLLNVRVTDRESVGLATLEVHSSGRLMVSGTTDGSVYVHELSDSLCVQGASEKQDLLAVFEREAKREKNVDARVKEQRLREKKEGKDKSNLPAPSPKLGTKLGEGQAQQERGPERRQDRKSIESALMII